MLQHLEDASVSSEVIVMSTTTLFFLFLFCTTAITLNFISVTIVNNLALVCFTLVQLQFYNHPASDTVARRVVS